MTLPPPMPEAVRPARATARIIVGAASVALIIAPGMWVARSRPWRRFVIAEESMAPTLRPGDHVLAVRRRPSRGVVAVVRPVGLDRHLVKRVIAGGGTSVEIGDGEVRVDGVVCDPVGELLHTGPPGRWTVAEDEMFVLSDARTLATVDSRRLGPVPAQPAWVVRWRYRPWGRRGRVG